jgi:subtilisin family serine protease
MRKRATPLIITAATGIALSLGPAGWGNAVEVSGTSGDQANAGPDVTVTLVTGDRVVLPGGDIQRARVDPADGRENITFHVDRIDDRLQVIPVDAMPHIATGSLDRRLFDVTGLIEAGYDDADRDTVPLIVTSNDRMRAASSPFADAGAAVTRDLPAVNGVAAEVAKADASAFWESIASQDAGEATTLADSATRIWLDGVRTPMLDRSTGQIGAPAAWDAGLTGDGVRIAVLDTGVDATHPDLAGRVAAVQNFTYGPDFDDVGHGTHVASIAAGTGAASEGRYRGVADGATLLDGKVCEFFGCMESSVLAGMHWATVEQDADIVNLSLGAPDTPEVDLLEDAVNRLTAETGALFVVAAGNSGPHEETVSSPASAESALAVGAVNQDDELTSFSSRGPRLGDGGIKPDVTAPGFEIVAARASTADIGDPVDEHYVPASGTSMATPHVAGAAALLAQAHPDWTPEQLKSALMSSARPHQGLSMFEQGAGRLDVAAAMNQAVLSEPANIPFGRHEWPHEDDAQASRTLTFHNTGTTDATLQLSVTGTGPDGSPAPDGMFTTTDDEIIVAAGASASTTVMADTRLGGPDGYYTGQVRAVVAGSSDQVVRVPFAVDKEVESYDVTLEHTDRTGAAAAYFSTGLHDHHGEDFWELNPYYGDEPRTTLRVPKGEYFVASYIQTPTQGEVWDYSVLSQPLLDVSADVTVDLDARIAQPVSLTPPDDSAALAFVDVGYTVQLEPEGRSYVGGFLGGTFDGNFIGHLGPELPGEQAESRVAAYWNGTPNADGDPSLYALAWFLPGRLPTGYERAARPDELATVHMNVAEEAPDQGATASVFGKSTAGVTDTAGPFPDLDLPGKATMYVTTENTLWNVQMFTDSPSYRSLWSQPTAYEGGQTYEEEWNTAVFGPSLPPVGLGSDVHPAYRIGDEITFNVPLQSDGDGHGGVDFPREARTVLYADGELVGESDIAGVGWFDVPGRAVDYRLETSLDRNPGGDLAGLSPRVSATWTFRSEHSPGDEPTPLPVSVVRFSPDLDEYNRMAARPVVRVPVRVESQPGAADVPWRNLKVDVSQDDGTTWKPARVIPSGDVWSVLVEHESDARFVSLRASAEDLDGNTVEQTIIRAYELAG